MNEKAQWDARVFGPEEDNSPCGRTWEFIRMGVGSPFIVYCTGAGVPAVLRYRSSVSLRSPFVPTSLLLNPAHCRCVIGSPKLDSLGYSGSEPAFRAAPHAKDTQTPGRMQSAQLKFNTEETGGLFFFLRFCFIFQKKHFPNIAQKMSMRKQLFIIYLKF